MLWEGDERSPSPPGADSSLGCEMAFVNEVKRIDVVAMAPRKLGERIFGGGGGEIIYLLLLSVCIRSSSQFSRLENKTTHQISKNCVCMIFSKLSNRSTNQAKVTKKNIIQSSIERERESR